LVPFLEKKFTKPCPFQGFFQALFKKCRVLRAFIKNPLRERPLSGDLLNEFMALPESMRTCLVSHYHLSTVELQEK
jgi:hypothetical protein